MPSTMGYRLPHPVHRNDVAFSLLGKGVKLCLHCGQTMNVGSPAEKLDGAPMDEVYRCFRRRELLLRAASVSRHPLR
jgi:hypothetical protein